MTREEKFVFRMRYLLAASAAFTVALAFKEPEFIAGNYYGTEVAGMKVTGFDGSGEYNSVNGMDVDSGTCSSRPEQYSGPLGPLGKEVRVLRLHSLSTFWCEMLITSPGLASRSWTM